jgi:DivIVA domain-containing protein
MKNSEIKKSENISFNKQLRGYNKDEVNQYIKTLSQEYQTAYEKYNEVSDLHNDLLQKQKTFEDVREEQNQSIVDMMTKMHLDMEALAQKTVGIDMIAKMQLDMEALAKKTVGIDMIAKMQLDIEAKMQHDMETLAQKMDALVQKTVGVDMIAQMQLDMEAKMQIDMETLAQKIIADVRAEIDEIKNESQADNPMKPQTEPQTKPQTKPQIKSQKTKIIIDKKNYNVKPTSRVKIRLVSHKKIKVKTRRTNTQNNSLTA